MFTRDNGASYPKGLQNSLIFVINAAICWLSLWIFEGRHWVDAVFPASKSSKDRSSVTANDHWGIVSDHRRIAYSEFPKATIPIILDAASQLTICSNEKSTADLLYFFVRLIEKALFSNTSHSFGPSSIVLVS